MKTKVLWLGFTVPDDLARELFGMDPIPAVQTHKFGWSFTRALKHAFGDVALASACPVQNFPLVRRLVFWGGGFSSKGVRGVLLGFVNVLLLKHLTRFLACLISVVPMIRRERFQWVFVHGLHTPYLFFALLSHLFGCRVAVVLTDPPGVVLATDSRLAKLMKKLDVWLVGRFLRRMDAVFALAPDLVNRLAPTRPALIFPGILDSTLDIFSADQPWQSGQLLADAAEPFTVIYAGGLSSAYGVDRLVDAVLGFDAGESIRLKLYGRGDQENRIKRLAASDCRIEYGGFVDTETLLPELKSADLLINPRPTRELFAAMSFPSKLIEYLATARPVLTTRIPSIPDDLKSHFYFITDESADGIRVAIREIMQMPVADKAKRGIAAQKYLLASLSEMATGIKIKEFVDQLK